MAKHRIPESSGTAVEPVSAVLSWQVRPGRESAFEEWAQGILGTIRQQPGFVSTTTLRPPVPGQPYHIVLQFDTASSLATWLGSTERFRLVRASKEIGTQYRADSSGLETWFDLPGFPMKRPTRWKPAVLAFLAVYPVVILFNWLVASSLRTEQLWLRSLWLPLVLAPALTYLLLPGLSRLFRRWLRR
jgi:antibiotic biosynthesis monooxygenase (ABM) superfamily enzyme